MPSKRVSLKGKGADLFFGDYTVPGVAPSTIDAPAEESSASAIAAAQEEDETPPPPALPAPTSTRSRARSTRSSPAADQAAPLATSPASTLASVLASQPTSSTTDVVDTIRRAVKISGKEVSFTRLTPEEKAQLADIVYAYKRQGQKTTENEINRIALNYLLVDYHERGSESVLAQVLASLLA
jgi:hypothetical protein